MPGGGLSPDGERWVSCRPGFFLPVRVLSRLFRRLFLDGLAAAHADGRLVFFGDLAPMSDRSTFAARLAPLRRAEWVVYAKRPFAGPESVLAYLAHYTHRVAISSSRLVSLDERGVTFRWKDDRQEGSTRRKLMTLDAGEFMRRFLIHVFPSRFDRIRHYGLFTTRPAPPTSPEPARCCKRESRPAPRALPSRRPLPSPRPPGAPAAGPCALVEIFERGCAPRTVPPRPAFRIDSS